jgi:diguanylate cyclase (GGDEF)-like protein
LTDVFNRRGFIGAVERERNRAVRNGLTLGLMLIDVDFLKNINDAYGHRAGDRVLIEIARRLQRSLRSYDVCARWGGDEFAVLVSDCTARTLSTIADKTLAAVSAEPVKLENAVEAHLTISIGACLVCAGESVDAINAKADSALYAAKDAGRNRIVIYDDAREKKPANIQAD